MIRAELDEVLNPGHAFSRRPRARAPAHGVEAVGGRGDAVVCTLCRSLIDVGVDPSEPMEVYRGKTLALHVRSIGEAAKLTVYEQGVKFAKWSDPASRGYVVE